MPKSIVMLCYEGNLSDLNRPGWVAQEKWDGTRVKSEARNGKITLTNRWGIDYTSRLPETVEALKRIKHNFIGDGEVVYVNPLGQVEFTACQSLLS